MDGVEPELFFNGGVWAEPGFEIFVGSLPVMPVSGDGTHGTGFSAEVVDVERLENESWFAGSLIQVIEHKFSIFGKIKFGVENKFTGDFGAIKFVDGRIHTTIYGEEIQNIGFGGFVWFAVAERIDVDILGGFLAKMFIMNAADRKRDLARIWF